MKRDLSDIPTAELSALVEQGMPVSDYAAEIERRRKPDCVFDIWSDNVIAAASAAEAKTVLKIKEQLQRLNRGLHVTHRIRVFLKGAGQ